MSRALTARRKRLLLIVATGVLLVAAGFFVKQAFRENLVFYVTPSDVAAGQARGKDILRIGGMVQVGSVQRSQSQGLDVRFTLVDDAHAIPVVFHGVLPDLFSEGKGAIAQGKLENGTLIASEVLAKHDENYTPPKGHETYLDRQASVEQGR